MTGEEWAPNYLAFAERFEAFLDQFVEVALELDPLSARLQCGVLFSAKEIASAQRVGYELAAEPETAVAAFVAITSSAHHESRKGQPLSHRLIKGILPPKRGTLDHKLFLLGRLAVAILGEAPASKQVSRQFGERYIIDLERRLKG